MDTHKDNTDDTDHWKTRDSVESTDKLTNEHNLHMLPILIGRYSVIRLLGEGSFGRVYLALDENLDRRVAIKVPRPERASQIQGLESYVTEGRNLAYLDHPRIVPVYDSGKTDDGLWYIAFKYIEGTDLATLMRNRRFSHLETAKLISTVAEALQHAHSRGLIHRDIKPANILLDLEMKPCIADFGLALRDRLTSGGSNSAGTLAYMSPEQVRGEVTQPDGRTDIYSLGVVFYELLVGQRPFKANSFSELAEAIANTEVIPPRQLDGTIPRSLEQICLKCLSNQLASRYSTSLDLHTDLLSWIESQEKNVSVSSLANPAELDLKSSKQPSFMLNLRSARGAGCLVSVSLSLLFVVSLHMSSNVSKKFDGGDIETHSRPTTVSTEPPAPSVATEPVEIRLDEKDARVAIVVADAQGVQRITKIDITVNGKRIENILPQYTTPSSFINLAIRLIGRAYAYLHEDENGVMRHNNSPAMSFVRGVMADSRSIAKNVNLLIVGLRKKANEAAFWKAHQMDPRVVFSKDE